MKKLLAALAALALLTGAGLAERAGNLLGLSILRDQAGLAQNAAVSPLSLYLALDMAREGAAGETLAELDALLSGEAVDAQALAESGLRLANAVFLDEKYALLPEYAARVDAEWFSLEGGADAVNDWVRARTGGLIERLLEEAPGPDDALYLVNALAMKDGWRYPFDEENTRREVFYAADDEDLCDMMYIEEGFLYGERAGAQLVRLPYASSSLAMYVVLPEREGMAAALEALAAEGMAYFDAMAYGPEVRLWLPRFSLECGGSLMAALRARGLETAAGGAADFSRMCALPLKIGDVIQRVRIDVDEWGTSAAAATLVAMEAMAAPDAGEPEVVKMRVDRPFVIVICEETSGAIAFAAAVAEV